MKNGFRKLLATLCTLALLLTSFTAVLADNEIEQEQPEETAAAQKQEQTAEPSSEQEQAEESSQEQAVQSVVEVIYLDLYPLKLEYLGKNCIWLMDQK